MITRKKIVPPVTPKIIQSHRGQQPLRYAILACLVVVIAMSGYYYGRGTVTPGAALPANSQGTDEEQQQRIAMLEQERDALQKQVADLEQRVTRADKALRATQDRQLPRQQSPDTGNTLSKAEKTPPVAIQDTAAVNTANADYRLELENIRIEQTEAEDTYRVVFSLLNAAHSDERITGTIWIAVNGLKDKQPVRLSLKRLSPQARPYVKMGFERQQDIDQEVVLPADFRPRNILIEAKPYGDKYTGTSARLDWETGD